MATIVKLPDIWKTDGKADIDGVLAAGHTPEELGKVFASATEPDRFVGSLPEEERQALTRKLDKSTHPIVLRGAVQSVNDKREAVKLALRVGMARDQAIEAELVKRAFEQGWPFGPIRSALNEGRRQAFEQDNRRRIESGELSLLHDERHGRAWFLDHDNLVEMKLDATGRACIVALTGNPAESAVRKSLNAFLHLARAEGTRVEPQALTTKPEGLPKLYVASEPARLVCVGANSVTIAPNGVNQDRVFVLPPVKWKSWGYKADVDQSLAAQSLLDDVSGTWALSPIDRLLLLGLALNVFLLPLLPGLGLVILAGLYGLGKTTIASALGRLLDGAHVEPVALKDEEVLRRSTDGWMLFIDEAEPVAVEKLSRTLNILSKGNVGLDRPASALPVLCAANLKLMPGTAQRAFILPVGKEHQLDVQVNDAAYSEAIAARRDEYLSMVMQVMAQKVLPSVLDGTLTKIVDGLNTEAADHPNRRNFHALATAWLIVNGLHEVAGRKSPDELLAAWLASQASRHLALAADTSELVAGMEALRVSAEGMAPERFQTEYTLRYDPQSRTISCCSRELLQALKALNHSFSLKTSGDLTTALKANLDVLTHRGWTVRLCAKVVNGDNVHEIVFPVNHQ